MFPSASDFINLHTHADDHHQVQCGVFNIFAKNMNCTFHADCFYSIGIHPWHVKEETFKAELLNIRQVLKRANCIAIGECGLDKSIAFDMALQRKVFLLQIELSEEFKKPMIIHCVRAYNDLIQIRKELKPKMAWIIHGFNSSEKIAGELLKYYCYLSFGMILFSKFSRVPQFFHSIPNNKIFLETDEAEKTIDSVYLFAAQMKNIEVSELKSQISKNFTSLFRPN